MAETKDELPVVAWCTVGPLGNVTNASGAPANATKWRAAGCDVRPLTSHAAAQSRINALLEEVEALRKDAERYRWLRHGDNDEKVIKRGPVAHDFVYLLRMEKLDAAIDASLSAGRSGSGEVSNG